MKQSQVKPGVRALLSLGGRRGDVAVLVRYQHRPERAGDVRWAVMRESDGTYYTATPRQLRPLPHVACQTELAAAYDAHLSRQLRAGAAQPGQTIDAGDVVIETTLHRLG